MAVRELKYLFLCYAGEKRSPTAASIAREIAGDKGLDAKMSSGAFSVVERAGNSVVKHINRYNKIFVMERYMQNLLKNLGVDKRKIHCLNILDIYERNDAVLRALLKRKLRKLI